MYRENLPSYLVGFYIIPYFKMTFYEYYDKRWGLKIKDIYQPLIVTTPKVSSQLSLMKIDQQTRSAFLQGRIQIRRHLKSRIAYCVADPRPGAAREGMKCFSASQLFTYVTLNFYNKLSWINFKKSIDQSAWVYILG